MESSFEHRPIFGLAAPETGAVPLAGVRVTGDILGRGARVRVEQRFRNGEAQAVEAVYRFPLPEGAAVCGFEARVGARIIRGAVEEREKAFEIYDQALAEGHGGLLLDEERPNVFALSVGNLEPDAEVTVRIDYVTLLDVERGTARFLLPTTIAPRYLPDPDAEEEGLPVAERLHPPYAGQVPYGLSLELRLHRADLLASIESPSHAVRVEPGGEPARVSLSADSVRMDRDFVLVLGYRGSRPSRAWRVRDGRGVFLQLDLSLPEEEGAAAGRKEILFLLDCSGSMQGSSIQEARRALAVCLKALAPGQRFNLVRFGSSHQDLFPAPREYGEGSLGEALAWLAKAEADLGGTELLPALRHLLEPRPAEGYRREVIVLTDGEVGNEAEVHALVRGHRADTRFFTVGIGMGPNEHLVRGVARAGGGASELIHPGERIEPKMLRLFQKLASRRFDGVRVQAGGERLEPAPASAALLPGSTCTLFARCAGGFAGGEVTVSGQADGEERRWVVPVADADGEQTPVPVLWARERIRDLEDAEEGPAPHGSRQRRPRPEGQAQPRREEVVRLSTGFGVLSRSTSFVAVEERAEAERTRGEVKLRKVPVLVTADWHGGAAAGGPLRAIAFREVGPASGLNLPLRGAERAFGGIRLMSFQAGPLPGFSSQARREAVGPGRPAGKLPKGAPGGGERMDLLLDLLVLQKAEGGFEPDPQTVRRLGLDPRDLEQAAERLEGRGGADAARLLGTALVLQVLETGFAAERPTWAGLVAKSRAWLDAAVGAAGSGFPRVGGRDLAAWAADLAGRVRLPA